MQPHHQSTQNLNSYTQKSIKKSLNLKPMPLLGGMPKARESEYKHSIEKN